MNRACKPVATGTGKILHNERSASFSGCTLLEDPLSGLESSLKIEWMTSSEAAEFLRISVGALLNMTSSGQVPFYKLGRRNRYRKDELENLLLQKKRGNLWD